LSRGHDGAERFAISLSSAELAGLLRVREVNAVLGPGGSIGRRAAAILGAAAGGEPRGRGRSLSFCDGIVHASERAENPRRRRVLQVDYANRALPSGLEWLGVADAKAPPSRQQAP
jgi:hypothetical protein